MWIGAVRDSGANPVLGCKSNLCGADLEGGGASNLTGADRGRMWIGAVRPASACGTPPGPRYAAVCSTCTR